jgi:hypothetical protein
MSDSMRSAAMQQHPDKADRDLDDEVAEVVEHQYARRLIKPAPPQKQADLASRAKADRAKADRSKADKDGFDDEIEKLREKAASDANLSRRCNGLQRTSAELAIRTCLCAVAR